MSFTRTPRGTPIGPILPSTAAAPAIDDNYNDGVNEADKTVDLSKVDHTGDECWIALYAAFAMLRNGDLTRAWDGTLCDRIRLPFDDECDDECDDTSETVEHPTYQLLGFDSEFPNLAGRVRLFDGDITNEATIFADLFAFDQPATFLEFGSAVHAAIAAYAPNATKWTSTGDGIHGSDGFVISISLA
jgi:hypothetical protein